MSNPPRKKGTTYETEVLRQLRAAGFDAERTSAGQPYDIRVRPVGGILAVNALAMRPDRGRTLVTMNISDFMALLVASGYGARIECKRFARSAHHTIYEEKFGR